MKRGFLFVVSCLLVAVLLAGVIIGMTPKAHADEPIPSREEITQAFHKVFLGQGYTLIHTLANGGRYYVKEIPGNKQDELIGFVYVTMHVDSKGKLSKDPNYLGEKGIIAFNCNRPLYNVADRKAHYLHGEPELIEAIEPRYYDAKSTGIGTAMWSTYCG